jgi:CBS domain-containing protein
MKPIRLLLENREVVVVDLGTSIVQAARVMSERQIGAVPVVDDDRVAGIFTERDILSRVVAAGVDPATTPVSSVMTTNLVTAEIGESHDVCMRRMQQARVRHLLVLCEGRLAGMLSMRDLVGLELDERDEAITLLNAYVHYIPADLQPTKSVT